MGTVIVVLLLLVIWERLNLILVGRTHAPPIAIYVGSALALTTHRLVFSSGSGLPIYHILDEIPTNFPINRAAGGRQKNVGESPPRKCGGLGGRRCVPPELPFKYIPTLP